MRLRQLVVATVIATAAFAAAAQDKVVYHIDDCRSQALKGLRNIRNHLDTEPTTKITVVTHADGRGLPDGRREGRQRQSPSPARWRRWWRAA